VKELMNERIKEFKIMKATLRYLLTVMATVSVLGVCAQSLAQQPQVHMTSTSGMMYSGSTLPQAAATGATLADESPAYAPGKGGRIRKDGNPFNPGGGGEITIGDVDNPNEPGTPLGDVFWPLMLLAFAYLVRRFEGRKV